MKIFVNIPARNHCRGDTTAAHRRKLRFKRKLFLLPVEVKAIGLTNVLFHFINYTCIYSTVIKKTSPGQF